MDQSGFELLILSPKLFGFFVLFPELGLQQRHGLLVLPFLSSQLHTLLDFVSLDRIKFLVESLRPIGC